MVHLEYSYQLGDFLSGNLPPSRPGSSSLGLPRSVTPSGLAGGSSNSVGSTTSRVSARPTVLLMIALIANLTIPLIVLIVYGLNGEWIAHAIGVAFGMFLGVILLGFYRQALNLRRAIGRFADWRISSTSLATLIATSAWLAGAVNLFVVCWEFSRRFTE